MTDQLAVLGWPGSPRLDAGRGIHTTYVTDAALRVFRLRDDRPELRRRLQGRARPGEPRDPRPPRRRDARPERFALRPAQHRTYRLRGARFRT